MSWQRFGSVFEAQWQALTQGVKSKTCAGPHRVQLIVLDGHTPALLDAILAEAHARGHILLATEEEDTGDSEVLEHAFLGGRLGARPF